MPLPTPPTIMLAAGGLALVLGRLLPRRFSTYWGWYFVIALVLVACNLGIDLVGISGLDRPFDSNLAWSNTSLVLAEEWAVLLFGLLSALIFFYSSLWQDNCGTTCGFLLLMIAGLMLVACANDLLSLGISLEIVNLAVMALHQSFESNSNVANRLPLNHTDGTAQRLLPKWYWLDGLASAWFWVGIAMLSNSVATTQFDSIRLILFDVYNPPQDGPVPIGTPSKLILFAVGLIVMGLTGKMGLVPFNLGFSTSVQTRTVLSGAFSKLVGQLAGFIALATLCGRVFVGLGHSLVVLLTVGCFATFVFSVLTTVRGFSPGVKSLPRLLTSLLQLQAAWFCVGLIVATRELEHPAGRWGAFLPENETSGGLVFALFAGILGSAGIFGILGYLEREDRGIEYLEDLRGLVQIAPVTAVALVASLASLIGCPWTAGYWSRWCFMLAGYNVHIKSTSSILDPHGGVRMAIFAGAFATIYAARAVIRISREIFLETPRSRPTMVGSHASLTAGLAAAMMSVMLGVAPQLLFIPLRTLDSPRELHPTSPPRGSGQNHSVLRTRSRKSSDFYGLACQARYSRQVDDPFLISTKLACCTWQSTNGSAQFCPVWSGTSSPGHQTCEDNPFILVDPYS